MWMLTIVAVSPIHPECTPQTRSSLYYVERWQTSILGHITHHTIEAMGFERLKATGRCWIWEEVRVAQFVRHALGPPDRCEHSSPYPDLTHATLNFPENKGRAPELISMIDAARTEGVDVSLDTYPYLPGCTTLASLLPSWASSGGPSETLRRLNDAATREKIRIAIEETGCDGGHGIPTNWEQMQVSPPPIPRRVRI